MRLISRLLTPVDAYGNLGLSFAYMSHHGSILCFPSGIYGWGAADLLALKPQDLVRVLAKSGQVEILLVGTGKDLKPLPAELCATFKDVRTSADPIYTGAAVRTYNVLLAEDRAVVTAFITVD